MEVNNCTDINGVALDRIQFNTDGTVLGVLVIDGVESTTTLSAECCANNGHTAEDGTFTPFVYDPTDTKCYWSNSCLVGSDYKIILDPEGNTGAYFQVDPNQDNCILELEFDYLLRFDCETILNSALGTFLDLKLDIGIEKVVYNPALPIPDNLELVKSEELFHITNVVDFFSGNTNTGITLDGNNCDAVIFNFKSALGENAPIITDDSLNSGWVKYKMVIDDPAILETIYNERLKVSIRGNSLANFAILVDNIKLNRICTGDEVPLFLDEECPKFNLERVIDNKKSWVNNSDYELREFDLSRRECKYPINNEKLSINTKEIDLLINPSQAVENNILDFVIENPCILDPATGCTSGNTTHDCIDITELMTTPITEFINSNDLLNELIDVKSRKTLSSYPTIDLLLNRYRNSEEHCGIENATLDIETVNGFIDLIGNFWTELIEQVVPATTIWGSSYSYGDNVFGTDKFKYRKSSLILCNSNGISYPSPSIGSEFGVEVIAVDITGETNGNPDICDALYVRQVNDGSEFIGTITIIGPDGGGSTTGSTITINETITDDCNKFEECN